MPRRDNVPIPPTFQAAADAHGLGAPVRVMQGGSGLQAMRDKMMTIAVCQYGAVINSTGPEPIHFRYDEVDRFTQFSLAKYTNGGYRGTDTTCWFGLRDGRTYRVTGRSTNRERHIVEDLRDLVDRPITMAQLPRMQAALQQGQNVDFGGYVMEPGGLYVPGGLLRREKRLPWAGIREVTVQAGGVKVMAHGRRLSWAIVNVHRVPNLTAFLTLTRALSGQGPG